MFKKMKRRLVFWNMLLLVIVFAVILLAIAVITTVSSYRETRGMLKITLAASQFPAGGFHEPPKKEGMSGGIPMSAITVWCDGSGTVLSIKAPPQADEGLIRKAVDLVLEKGTDLGYLALNHEVFAFARGKFGGQQTVVLLDQQAQMASIRSTLLTLLAIAGVSLVLLFGVSVLFAERTVQPIRAAYQKQENFVADASHELKTPLSILAANLSVIRSAGNQPVSSQEKWLYSSEQQIRKMTGLINDMLLLASFRDQERRLGKQEQQALPLTDFSEVVTGTLLSFEAVTFERNLPMESQVEERITVRGGEEQLNRLVTVLLDNAIKYAGENGGVEVQLRREQGKAYFSVCNRGTLIAPEHLPHLFDRFYRVDSARTQRTGGSGLGLSIAQSIAHSLGGEIRVESSAEKGTCFTVTLPCAVARGENVSTVN